MAMNREQKRMLQRQGALGATASGSPKARKAPATRRSPPRPRSAAAAQAGPPVHPRGHGGAAQGRRGRPARRPSTTRSSCSSPDRGAHRLHRASSTTGFSQPRPHGSSAVDELRPRPIPPRRRPTRRLPAHRGRRRRAGPDDPPVATRATPSPEAAGADRARADEVIDAEDSSSTRRRAEPRAEPLRPARAGGTWSTPSRATRRRSSRTSRPASRP